MSDTFLSMNSLQVKPHFYMLDWKQEASANFRSYWQVYCVHSHVRLCLKVGREMEINNQQPRSQ